MQASPGLIWLCAIAVGGSEAHRLRLSARALMLMNREAESEA